ncbi:hypothetical protein QRT08_14930 [Halalkalicoccus sp. NIPERK01]|nr:hypothetical protein [Halalkalicoccus sp. NIPERK01]MDL5363258.1 hypothetical protein [Halalkalicoccus sp. NIPERK01]
MGSTGTAGEWERILVTDDHPYMDAWWPTGHIIGWEHAFVHENYEFPDSNETIKTVVSFER